MDTWATYVYSCISYVHTRVKRLKNICFVNITLIGIPIYFSNTFIFIFGVYTTWVLAKNVIFFEIKFINVQDVWYAQVYESV